MSLLILLVVVAIAIAIVRRVPHNSACNGNCNQGRNCVNKCTKHDS